MSRFDLPKRVKREISASEHLRAYYKRLVHEATKRGRIRSVERRMANGDIEVLQITDVLDSGDGLLIRVR